jgi:hypothetical protein
MGYLEKDALLLCAAALPGLMLVSPGNAISGWQAALFMMYRTMENEQ